MRKGKLIRIIKLLTKSEMKKFRDFINSPYFNKNKKCTQLFDLLYPFFPLFSDDILDGSHFTDGVYLKKRSMDNTKEELLRLLEQFLIQQNFEHRNELRTFFLLEELRERREEKHFSLIYKKTKAAISKKKQCTEVYFGEYLIEISQLEMLYQQMSSQKAKASQLGKVIIAFDKYCLSRHIWLDNGVLNTRELGSDEVRILTGELFEHSKLFLGLAERQPYKEETLIQLRVLLNQLLTNGKESDFIRLLDSLKENHSLIDGSDKLHFNKFIANYCIMRIIKGDSSYYRKLLDVYMFAIKTGTLIEGKYLHPNRLRNIITTSVKAGEIELAYGLLEKYIHAVNPIYQKVSIIYGKGYLCYQQKDYPNSLDYLKQCMDLKSLYGLEAEAIIYKIYYETNEAWAFDIPIKSFMVKLSRYRKTQPEYIIEGYLNFFRILKQIYRKKHDPNYTKKKEELISSIEKKENLSDKQWLLKKLDGLSNA